MKMPKIPIEQLLTLDLTIKIHDTIITRTGGLMGIRDKQLILSALANPLYEIFGRVLYPTIVEKAGIVFFSINKNHGFTDGNKRTACLLLDMILFNFGYELKVTDQEIEDMAIDVADNKINKENVFLWIHRNINYINS